MTNDKNMRTDTQRLKDVLQAYGADRSRWPHEDRVRFSQADVDATATGDLADAAELDAILSHATSPAAAKGLAARITSNILNDAASGEYGNVVAFAGNQDKPRRAPGLRQPTMWPAAALLAASLATGIVLGQSEILTGLNFEPSSGSAIVDELGDAVLGLQFSVDEISEDTL